jgi:6 kDa early secretory antigenic target
MNMQSMSVNPGQVRELSSYIAQKSGQIKGELETLETKVNALKAQWEGDAQGSYAQAQLAWDKQIGEMEALLTRIGVKLTEIADGYEAQDRRGAARFGG